MTYKILRHKDFTDEWNDLPVVIREQLKKEVGKGNPHIPKNRLHSDLANC